MDGYALTLLTISLLHQTAAYVVLHEPFCQDSSIEYNVSLASGPNSGKFLFKGRTNSVQECAQLCCSWKKCSLAVRVKGECFLVRCFSESTCASGNSSDPVSGDTQIIRINRQWIPRPSQNETLLHPVCPANEIIFNMKPVSGAEVGSFIDVGLVPSIKVCSKKCCERNVVCDIAFVLLKRCYLLKCKTEEACLMVLGRPEDHVFGQRMTVVAPFEYGRSSRRISSPSLFSSEQKSCRVSRVYRKAELLGGYQTGNWSMFTEVDSMHICTRLCCEKPNCDVAVLEGRRCSLMSCEISQACHVIESAIQGFKAFYDGQDQKSIDVASTIQFITKRYKPKTTIRENAQPSPCSNNTQKKTLSSWFNTIVSELEKKHHTNENVSLEGNHDKSTTVEAFSEEDAETPNSSSPKKFALNKDPRSEAVTERGVSKDNLASAVVYDHYALENLTGVAHAYENSSQESTASSGSKNKTEGLVLDSKSNSTASNNKTDSDKVHVKTLSAAVKNMTDHSPSEVKTENATLKDKIKIETTNGKIGSAAVKEKTGDFNMEDMIESATLNYNTDDDAANENAGTMGAEEMNNSIDLGGELNNLMSKAHVEPAYKLKDTSVEKKADTERIQGGQH